MPLYLMLLYLSFHQMRGCLHPHGRHIGTGRHRHLALLRALCAHPGKVLGFFFMIFFRPIWKKKKRSGIFLGFKRDQLRAPLKPSVHHSNIVLSERLKGGLPLCRERFWSRDGQCEFPPSLSLGERASRIQFRQLSDGCRLFASWVPIKGPLDTPRTSL